ncbi:MAG: DUF1667 domain-containing protein [Coriobacteriia bacterium]|nr:DUF1667 domain-containing protein [Coriobacteriia bacterium]
MSDNKNVQAVPAKWEGVNSHHDDAWVGGVTKSYDETYTCICCPLGCQVSLTISQGVNGMDVSNVLGHGCVRGKNYARQEAVHPVRMVTAAVPVQGCLCPVSVKTADAVPKNLIRAVLAELSDLSLVPPVREGDVLIPDVCGTGVDVIATKTVQ